MEGRTTMIRPAPWPLYDTEKVARWLEKMARQGFVLTEHGFPGTLPKSANLWNLSHIRSRLISISTLLRSYGGVFFSKHPAWDLKLQK